MLQMFYRCRSNYIRVMKKTAIIWFREDLRLTDNPAYAAAVESGYDLLPLYIFNENDGTRPLGGASRWWLHQSLEQLDQSLDGHLILRRGHPATVLRGLAQKLGGPMAIYWNRLYQPTTIHRDSAIKQKLSQEGLEVFTFPGNLLLEPMGFSNLSGLPFKVFTPFFKALKNQKIDRPYPQPPLTPQFASGIEGERLDTWQLTPTSPNWAEGFVDHWQVGEKAAQEKLRHFLSHRLNGYSENRNRPDLPNVSRLSPHLHFGEISAKQVWTATQFMADQNPELAEEADKFLSELVWREFSAHLLFHFPDLPQQNWRRQFDDFPWVSSDQQLKLWQRGLTGYPIVDAGMRELWQTGYMHNRVRMIVASFLAKDLLIDWRHGEAWFWDCLVDADLANNVASWQWVAGCGADAAPYFRIFNPVTQGQRFDPNGDYVRRFCPELARLPNDQIHAPFAADPLILRAAGVELGKNYPHPLVDHKRARDAALLAYRSLAA